MHECVSLYFIFMRNRCPQNNKARENENICVGLEILNASYLHVSQHSGVLSLNLGE